MDLPEDDEDEEPAWLACKAVADQLSTRMRNASHAAAARVPSWQSLGAPSTPLKGNSQGSGGGVTTWQGGMILDALRTLTTVLAQAVSSLFACLLHC